MFTITPVSYLAIQKVKDNVLYIWIGMCQVRAFDIKTGLNISKLVLLKIMKKMTYGGINYLHETKFHKLYVNGNIVLSKHKCDSL